MNFPWCEALEKIEQVNWNSGIGLPSGETWEQEFYNQSYRQGTFTKSWIKRWMWIFCPFVWVYFSVGLFLISFISRLRRSRSTIYGSVDGLFQQFCCLWSERMCPSQSAQLKSQGPDGVGPLGGDQVSESGAPATVSGVCALIKETPGNRSDLWCWGRRKRCPCQNTTSAGALTLDFPVSRGNEKGISVIYEPPSLCCLVVATQMY